MSNVNRHIEGNPNAILVSVASGVTVELGDLMFHDVDDDLRCNGSSTATKATYPFEYFRLSGSSLTLNKEGVKDYFLGIALDDVDGINNGVTNTISVGTMGKYELDLKPAKTVYPINMFGATGTTSASNLYNQKVMKVTDSDYALGYFNERKKHAITAEGRIRPAGVGLGIK